MGSGGDHRSRPRNRVSIYQKVQVIREMDRLIDEGVTYGIEKRIMKTFPSLFQSASGGKSGMLGRWKTQCDAQKWRLVPWERLSPQDREARELPDWMRIPLGMCSRSVERFKEGKNIPACVAEKMAQMVEKVVTGGETSQLTAGHLDTKLLKKEAESMLKIYHDAQTASFKEKGLEPPEQKTSISDRWVNRFLAHQGYKRKTPNTFGAYLPYEDERMEKSRKIFHFRRRGHLNMMFTTFEWLETVSFEQVCGSATAKREIPYYKVVFATVQDFIDICIYIYIYIYLNTYVAKCIHTCMYLPVLTTS